MDVGVGLYWGLVLEFEENSKLIKKNEIKIASLILKKYISIAKNIGCYSYMQKSKTTLSA